MALVLVAGLVVLARGDHARLQASAPVAAMLAGAVFFAITAEARRADISQPTVTPSRYIYVVAALVLPALALAADALSCSGGDSSACCSASRSRQRSSRTSAP